jgi:hypothetical protein
LMATPPALATDSIAGNFGSANATEDGGALEVMVGEPPLPPPPPEQAVIAAAANSTNTGRARMIAPL